MTRSSSKSSSRKTTTIIPILLIGSILLILLVGFVSLSRILRGIIGCTTTTLGKEETTLGGRKASPKAKWFNAIHVSTETDVLLMRFYEYDEFVDEFHIFETNITQWGTPKKRHFYEKLHTTDYYSKFASKIIYHDIPPLEEKLRRLCEEKHTWDCEFYFRRYVGQTMNKLLRPYDVLLTGDADEIASASVLQQIRDGDILLPARIKIPVYKYSLHWLQGGDHSPSWICDGEFAHEFDDYNYLRELGQNGKEKFLKEEDEGSPKRKYGYMHYTTIPKAGWHASSFGTIEQISAKMNSIIEGVDRQHSLEELERRVRNGTSTWDNPTQYFTYLKFPTIIPRIAVYEPEIWKNSLLRFGRNESEEQQEEKETESTSQQQ